MICNNCKNETIKQQPILVWREHGKHKIIGYEVFCSNINCNYYKNIKKQPK